MSTRFATTAPHPAGDGATRALQRTAPRSRAEHVALHVPNPGTRLARLRLGLRIAEILVPQSLREPAPAGRPALPAVAPVPDVGWIGHGGMAGSRPGAGPSYETLSAAARLGLDWLEVDVCVTRDEVLVLRHHHRLPGGRPVNALALAELRRVEPDIVTLSEAFDCLAGRVGLLIDVKSPGVVIALVAWLARRRGAGTFSVCSESPDALRHMRDRVAWVPRWRSITALWRWSPETIPPLLRPLVRDLFPGAMWSAADALVDAGGAGATQWSAVAGTEQVAERVRRALAATGRDRLPSRIGELAGEVGAAGLSVDHWAITARLCEAAHDLDLLIAAWTVNRIELARDLARYGVDLITSDDVATMRRAVALLGRPDARPGDQAVAISCRPPPTPPRGLPPDRPPDGRSPRQMTS